MKPGPRSRLSASLRISYTTLVPANLRGNLREVTHFEATDAGQGHGAALLQQVCQEADKAGIVLMLMPTTDRLAFFYGRHGFKPIQAEPAVMMRIPVHKLAGQFAEASHA